MDVIDRINDQWRFERRDLDPGPLELVGRVLVLAEHLQRSVNEALAEHGLTLGQFDILATLRRIGPGARLPPKLLMKSVALSSGGMTYRLDQLEEAGLVRREPDALDRRSIVVGLTRKGLEVIDAATTTRFDEAKRSLPPLSAPETAQLTRLLRTWLECLSAKTNGPS
jgi:DNA-binding MarR family transcriptional regulator